jgi:hypothetical protein
MVYGTKEHTTGDTGVSVSDPDSFYPDSNILLNPDPDIQAVAGPGSDQGFEFF